MSLAGKAATLLLLVARLEMFRWRPGKVAVEKEERAVKRRNALSLNHIKVN